MIKLAHVLHRTSGLSRDEFLRDYRRFHESNRKGSLPYSIHLPYPTDALRAGPLGAEARAARCDGLSFQWLADGSAATSGGEEAVASVDRCDGYLLDEVVHWDRLGDRPAGRASPGIKMIAVVRRRPGLSASEFRRRYLEHAAVAHEHHPGIARYVQNFVTGAITANAPAVDGIAELHFATEADLTKRFYRDDASPKSVAADIARFMTPRGSWSILATEYVVR